MEVYNPRRLCYNVGMSEPQKTEVPFFSESVAAGFPSPARGELNGTLDLNDLCIRHPAATYFVRARGESMVNAGIGDGDVLVVDRSLTAVHGDIIIASVAGEFTVKRLYKRGDVVRLMPENELFSPIDITPELGAEFFGVVTYVIRKLK